MESVAIFAVVLCLSSFLVTLLISAIASRARRSGTLPPGPARFPIIGNLHWLHVSVTRMEPLLRTLQHRYAGARALTLQLGSSPPIVYITDRNLVHEAMAYHGAAFAGRPQLTEGSRLVSNNGYTVTSATYGPIWRLLRRNLTSEILHASRVRLFSKDREWVLGVLLDNLRVQAMEKDGVVNVMDVFQYAMFCLLVVMCFGDRFGEEMVRQIEKVQRDQLLYLTSTHVFSFFPQFVKYMFPNKWKTFVELRRRQVDTYLPLIQARRKRRMEARQQSDDRPASCCVYSYVDSLLDLEIAEEKNRKLTDHEIAGLCSEFLNAGTDTSFTTLQWIMANVVKYPEIQSKLFDEVVNTNSTDANRVVEEDLPKMAVILEGLRRHPPAHFVLPHAMMEEVSLGGYVFPKGVSVNFAIAEIGWDRKVWKEPMEFKPERFLHGGEGEGVDITGSREVKMMPFGVGRRICPGMNLAMLHLEYFVANLVAAFEWCMVDGEEVDLEEKQGFFAKVMKNPLRARLVERHPNTA